MTCECGNTIYENDVFCTKCGKKVDFQNDVLYCDSCGCKLKADAVYCEFCGAVITKKTPESQKVSLYVQQPTPKPTKSTPNQTPNQWLAVLLAGAGALVGWYLSGFFGMVLGASALGLAIKQKKEYLIEQLPYVLTWVLAVVDFIFFIIASTL